MLKIIFTILIPFIWSTLAQANGTPEILRIMATETPPVHIDGTQTFTLQTENNIQHKTIVIVTQNGQKASITLGEKKPVISALETGALQTAYAMSEENFDTTLSVTPKVTNKRVNLTLSYQKNFEDQTGGGRQQIRKFNTSITIPFNQWILVTQAGSTEQENSDMVTYSTNQPKQRGLTLYVKVIREKNES